MHSLCAQRPRVVCSSHNTRRPAGVRQLRGVAGGAAAAIPPIYGRRLLLSPRVSAAETQSSVVVEQPGLARPEAVLCTKFKAHDAAITALAVLKDEPGFKQIVTASLDKSLAVWTLEGCDLTGPQLQCSRVEVAGGPVFSLQRGIKTKITDANVKPRDPVLFCGLAAKEITALRPDTLTFSQQMRMNGHTGWVRSLASSGKYLFSCGCNHLHQWDQAYAVPKEVRSVSLFTGDILALAATDKAVFTAGADGSLRRWALGKLGELSEAEVRDKAHDGRITALAVSNSLLFSAGYDGDIKAWDVASLQLVMEVKGAHAGERVRSLAMGPAPPASKSSSPSSSTAASPSQSPPSSPAPAATASLGEESMQCFEAQPVQPQPPQPTEQPTEQQQQQPPQGTPAVGDLGAAPDVQPAAEQACEYEPVPDAVAVQPAATTADAACEYEPVPDAVAVQPAATTAAQPPATAADMACGSQPVHDAAPAGAAPSAASSGNSSPASSRPSSPARPAVLYSAGDDGLVRRWDARLLTPAGDPLTVHHSAVKALAVGEQEVLVSGDASGEVAVWLL